MDILLIPFFLCPEEANNLFGELRDAVPWRQDTITVYGKEYQVPRLQQWYGDPGCAYTYSGITLEPHPWSPVLEALKEKVEAATGAGYNTALLNLYRNGNDTVGWHSDDEPELGDEPTIACVSLGAGRDLLMRCRSIPSERHTVHLSNGSLFVMKGRTQHIWQHSIPRRKRVFGPRISLTFRKVGP